MLTWVKIETPEGKRFTFYNTHFCVSQLPGGGQVSPEGNQMQAIATAEFMNVNTEPGTVHLLVGDLNAGQTSPTMLYLLEGQPLELNGVRFGNPVELDDTWELAPSNPDQTHPGTGAGGGFTVLDWILAHSFVNVEESTGGTEGSSQIDVTFVQSGDSLSGTLTLPEFGDFSLSGTVTGSAISFQVQVEPTTIIIMYSGKVVSANTITGTWVIPDADLEGTFRLERA